MFFFLLAPLVSSAVPNSVPQASPYGSVPAYFEKNLGQTSRDALFTARGAGFSLALQKHGATLAFAGAGEPARIQLEFVHPNPEVAATPENPLEGHTNYYLGSDPKAWITGVPQFGRIRYTSIYPGVDLVWHASGRQLEYDLELQPNANPAQIRLRFAGTDGVSIAANGDLLLRVKGAQMRQLLPAAWQERGGRRVRVDASYFFLAKNDVGVRLAHYEPSQPLTIDPVLSYATYIGGSGPATIAALAVDAAGNAYIAGSTGTSDLPGTPDPSTTPAYFAAKLNATGTALAYVSYFTNNGYEEGFNAIAVDTSGNAYLAGITTSAYNGVTTSAGLPVTPGAFQTTATLNAVNGYIGKLDANGALVFGTYLDGSNASTSVTALALGPAGIYVTGSTGPNFPTTPGAYQTNAAGGAFMTILNSSGSALVYSTYLAGSGTDLGNAIAVDASGNVYIGGQTTSSAFPVTPGVFQSQLNGPQNGFLTKFGPAGNLVYSTLLGGSQTDSISTVSIDSLGEAYVAGVASSTNFPTTPDAFNSGQPGPFAAKLNASATALVYSTILATGSQYWLQCEAIGGISPAPDGSLYVAGVTSFSPFPATPGALATMTTLPPSGYCVNAPYLLQLSANGSSLEYSTLVAGSQFSFSGFETAKGVALDSVGNIYLAASSGQEDMPTTPGVLEGSIPSSAYYSPQSGFVAKIDMASTVLCSLSLSANSIQISGTGGTGSVNLTVPAGCPWEAIPSGWITITSATRGTTSATVSFSVGVNNNTNASQTGTIQFGSTTYSVIQAAGSCTTPVLSPASLEFTNAGGIRSIGVSLPDSCPLTAAGSSGWIQVSSSGTTYGSGTVSVYLPANDFAGRSGTVAIATQTVPVTQDAGPCTATLSASPTSFPAAGGTGAFQIATSTPSCAWAVYGVPAWLQVNATPLSGQGSANLNYIAAPNLTPLSQTATLTVAGQNVSISQAAGPAGNIPGSYTKTLFAGTGQCCGDGVLGDGGLATLANLDSPQGLAWSNGNLYIADSLDYRVRVVTPDGLIDTFAGGGSATTGAATNVYLGVPDDLAFGPDGSMYVTSTMFVPENGGAVWKIDTGIAGIVAGEATNGAADQLTSPIGVAIDPSNNLYIADRGDNRVQKLSNGAISTLVGSKSCAFGGDGGPASAASICNPSGLVFGTPYGLVLADSGNNRLRAISSNNTITTLAGGGSGPAPATGTYVPATSVNFYNPYVVTIDPIFNNLYFTAGGAVWRLIAWNNGSLTTPLIAQISGGTSGITFESPNGVAADTAGNVYVSDSYAVWQLTPGYSFCSSSTASGAPALTPSGGAAGIVLNPILTWTGVSGATSYTVNFGASNPPPVAATSTCTTYSPATLLPNTTYYWQVTPQGAGAASAVQSFTTQTGEIGAAALTLTTTGDGIVTPSPASPDGTYYSGTTVCLTATPNSGWTFSSWSGAALNSSGCLTLTGSVTVTANFVPYVACPSAVSPSAVYLDSTAQSGPQLSVTGSSGCSWTATPAGNFITVASGAGATGNGTVNFTVAANTTGADRNGTLTIGAQTISVIQRANTQIFTDVPPSAYYFDFTNLMAIDGITAGCSTNPPEYCPNDSITREQMAVFVVVSVIGGDSFAYTAKPYFTDVPSNSPFFSFIQKLRDLGITAGCSATEFCPYDTVTRDEMAAFIIRSRYEATPFTYPATPYFSDEPPTDVFFPFVQKMAQDGITAGCGGGLYCPTQTLNRGQMAVFIVTGALNQLLPAGTPYLATASPNLASPGQTLTVTLTGVNTNFVQETTQVTAAPGITVSNTNVINPTTLTVQLTVAAGTAPNPTSLIVTTGTQQADLPNGLTIQ